MSLSRSEQYLLELINRARLDPASEALRYGVSLNAGLPTGTISNNALQVLAPNENLNVSAQVQSEWMLDADVFSHTGENNSTPDERMADAGYEFSGHWSWNENLAWTGTTGVLDLEAAIDIHQEGLYLSPGHRRVTFTSASSEIGISQERGDFVLDGTSYDSSMVTLNFASSGAEAFVTGVVFEDRDGNEFYSIGEGRANTWFRADGKMDISAQAGGFALAVTANANQTVTIGQGDLTLATVVMDMSDGNGKLDLMTYGDGSSVLLVSANTTLVSGLGDATLLGVADLTLTGSDADNVLIGNSGDNILSGAGGNDLLLGGGGRDVMLGSTSINADVLIGGVGDDRLLGQAGADRLVGGAGDDIVTGGGGRDTFVFTQGKDQITDFTANVDLIEIWTDQTLDEVFAMGQITDGNAVFDFGDGNVLTLLNVDQIAGLEYDLLII